MAIMAQNEISLVILEPWVTVLRVCGMGTWIRGWIDAGEDAIHVAVLGSLCRYL